MVETHSTVGKETGEEQNEEAVDPGMEAGDPETPRTPSSTPIPPSNTGRAARSKKKPNRLKARNKRPENLNDLLAAMTQEDEEAEPMRKTRTKNQTEEDLSDDEIKDEDEDEDDDLDWEKEVDEVEKAKMEENTCHAHNLNNRRFAEFLFLEGKKKKNFEQFRILHPDLQKDLESVPHGKHYQKMFWAAVLPHFEERMSESYHTPSHRKLRKRASRRSQ
jgi:hypothetical protein